MTTALEERDYWDDLAAVHPMRAAWGDEGDGVYECLKRLDPIGRDVISGRVLDLGCGPGRLAIPLAMGLHHLEIVGVDLSRAMLAAARKRRDERGLHNARFLPCDGRLLPDVDTIGPIDAAYSVLLFQHLTEDAIAGYLSQIAERLPVGGAFRFQYVEGDSHGPFDHKYHGSRIASLCERAGFSDTHFDLEAGPFNEWTWVTATRHGHWQGLSMTVHR